MTPQELRAIRSRLGLGRGGLAARLGVSRSTVWRWEHGIHPVDAIAERLLRILSEAEQQRGREEES